MLTGVGSLLLLALALSHSTSALPAKALSNSLNLPQASNSALLTLSPPATAVPKHDDALAKRSGSLAPQETVLANVAAEQPATSAALPVETTAAIVGDQSSAPLPAETTAAIVESQPTAANTPIAASTVAIVESQPTAANTPIAASTVAITPIAATTAAITALPASTGALA